MPRATKLNTNYMLNGVMLSPATPSEGDTAKIVYDGLLSKNGASHIYAHIGFGNTWNEVNDYKMARTSTGFEATVPIQSADTLNICFKDCADNWDNNSGKNYTFDISR